MSIIYDRLIEYSKSDSYPFHMPGHKRNLSGDVLSEVSRIDITEIDGFDNLHDAEGIIKEAQIRAARLYDAEESFFLVNGSTCGILSAIAACVPNGGWLLMGRNCHKSVYHAALLGNLRTIYLQPKQKEEFSFCEGFCVDEIKDSVEAFYKNHPTEKLGAVIITSPTYEGVLSDVKNIAKYLHEKEIPLIVDEAHGAHLGLANNMPENSCRQGADLVIHSLHKTMPAMTQTALLHVNGNLVDRQRLRRFLSIYQSSSPSYVLMASIDRCLTMMAESGEDYFIQFLERKKNLQKALKSCKRIKIYEGTDADPCKLILSTKESAWSGKILYDKLRLQYHLQAEMAAGDYVVAILTVMDTKEGFDRLAEAVIALDQELDAKMSGMDEQLKTLSETDIEDKVTLFTPKAEYTIAEAVEMPHTGVLYTQAAGRVSTSFVYVYPPGIPILAPGEKIEERHISLFEKIQKNHLDLKGIKDGKIEIVSR